MSLTAHAERELKLAGLFDKNSDYGGALGPAILGVVKAFTEYGHSGGSATVSLSVLEKLLRFENLTPITDHPDEWMDVAECGPSPMWQCVRNHRLFSEDGGKTHYDVDDPNRERKQTLPSKPTATHDCDGPDCCERRDVARTPFPGGSMEARVSQVNDTAGVHIESVAADCCESPVKPPWISYFTADEIDRAEKYFAEKIGRTAQSVAELEDSRQWWKKKCCEKGSQLEHQRELNDHLREMLSIKGKQLVEASAKIEKLEAALGRVCFSMPSDFGKRLAEYFWPHPSEENKEGL